MKDLKLEQKKQIHKIRKFVYNILDASYVFDRDKFIQKIIKETYLKTKEELLFELFNQWIECNNKETEDSFLILFEKKFRANLQDMKYECKINKRV